MNIKNLMVHSHQNSKINSDYHQVKKSNIEDKALAIKNLKSDCMETQYDGIKKLEQINNIEGIEEELLDIALKDSINPILKERIAMLICPVLLDTFDDAQFPKRCKD
ncbi:MAG: hypothetical protein HQK78_19610, partial [Desulfobacterales bacterium]|nr:hypothetical protein [Desulfobacterales bacterium]